MRCISPQNNSSESKVEKKLEVRNTKETDKDRRKSPALKPSSFDGSTPVEAFLQQVRACAQYYKWTDESSVQMKCALSGDVVT